MSGSSPSDSSRSTIEKEFGVGFLGPRGLCTGSRGWEGCCVWGAVPLSQRRPGMPLSPRPLIGLKFRVKVRAGLRGEVGRDPRLIGEQLVHRVAHSAFLRGMVDSKENNKSTVIRVGKWSPSMRKL